MSSCPASLLFHSSSYGNKISNFRTSWNFKYSSHTSSFIMRETLGLIRRTSPSLESRGVSVLLYQLKSFSWKLEPQSLRSLENKGSGGSSEAGFFQCWLNKSFWFPSWSFSHGKGYSKKVSDWLWLLSWKISQLCTRALVTLLCSCSSFWTRKKCTMIVQLLCTGLPHKYSTNNANINICRVTIQLPQTHHGCAQLRGARTHLRFPDRVRPYWKQICWLQTAASLCIEMTTHLFHI